MSSEFFLNFQPQELLDPAAGAPKVKLSARQLLEHSTGKTIRELLINNQPLRLDHGTKAEQIQCLKDCFGIFNEFMNELAVRVCAEKHSIKFTRDQEEALQFIRDLCTEEYAAFNVFETDGFDATGHQNDAKWRTGNILSIEALFDRNNLKIHELIGNATATVKDVITAAVNSKIDFIYRRMFDWQIPIVSHVIKTVLSLDSISSVSIEYIKRYKETGELPSPEECGQIVIENEPEFKSILQKNASKRNRLMSKNPEDALLHNAASYNQIKEVTDQAKAAMMKRLVS